MQSNNKWTKECKEYFCHQSFAIDILYLSFRSTRTAIQEPFVYTTYQQNREGYNSCSCKDDCQDSRSSESRPLPRVPIVVLAAIKKSCNVPNNRAQETKTSLFHSQSRGVVYQRLTIVDFLHLQLVCTSQGTPGNDKIHLTFLPS